MELPQAGRKAITGSRGPLKNCRSGHQGKNKGGGRTSHNTALAAPLRCAQIRLPALGAKGLE